MTNEEILEDMGYEGVVIFGNPSDYDSAIIGITTDNRVVYDYELMVKSLMERDKMTEDEAIEWIDYNTLRALDYMSDEGKPIVMYPLWKEEKNENNNN